MYVIEYQNDPLFVLRHPPVNERQRFRLKQNLLKWLIHTQHCCYIYQPSNYRCSHTQCQRVFPLMWHMRECREMCRMPFCTECKELLEHYENCPDVECTFCLKMHQLTTWRFLPDPQMAPSTNPNVTFNEEDRAEIISLM